MQRLAKMVKLKFLFYLFFFFLLLDGLMSLDLIRASCKKAAKKDPNFRYKFCVASLEENPKSQNASLRGLAVISSEKAFSNATRIEQTISKIMKKKSDESSEIPLRDCLQLYSDARNSLTRALGGIKSRDYMTANVVLSSALDAPSTCETGFKEKKHKKSPLTKENNVFFQMILIPLAFTNMLQ